MPTAPPPTDTGERDFPPVRTTEELDLLTGMLDWYREGVLVKVAGISQANASARPLRSATSIAGLVKHLAVVEDSWIEDRFAGHPEPEPWASAPWDDDRDWEFTTGPTEPIEDVVGLYRAAIERSRAAVCVATAFIRRAIVMIGVFATSTLPMPAADTSTSWSMRAGNWIATSAATKPPIELPTMSTLPSPSFSQSASTQRP